MTCRSSSCASGGRFKAWWDAKFAAKGRGKQAHKEFMKNNPHPKYAANDEQWANQGKWW